MRLFHFMSGLVAAFIMFFCYAFLMQIHLLEQHQKRQEQSALYPVQPTCDVVYEIEGDTAFCWQEAEELYFSMRVLPGMTEGGGPYEIPDGTIILTENDEPVIVWEL